MHNLIIRADDLGYSKGVNYGIYEAVKNGIINNVGVMVNMADTVHGLDLLKGFDFDLGMHTVICAGRPITDPKLIPSLVTADGSFKPSKVYRQADHDLVNLDEVVMEIEAQYQRFLELTNKKPDYFEAHAVYSNNLLKGLAIVAEKHDLPLLPFDLELDPVKFKKQTTITTFMDSMKPNYDPYRTFAHAVDFAVESSADDVPMMVCHPGFLDQSIMQQSSLTIPRTQEVAFLCDPQLPDQLAEKQIHLVRYTELS
ncbi:MULTISPECIES: ChbG/HpnK family deacetylase [unclassified Lactobacillus]|uniref:ChbG/HpnK family deacetylase n=1 Tax=unclassified Lactobacillus TaxID=2620435 RepID=UPI0023F95F18|nr:MULTISPECIES: ChbG/HpnK family deacetylase [unclassified Lactobacillus]MDF7669159.1 ChbG/HpnK family deacetylase [Lactobacillus sp. ESL0703]WEV38851.1 ChbG/HpnK family deacetylase [Lactobacillus sp. ESL0680]